MCGGCADAHRHCHDNGARQQQERSQSSLHIGFLPIASLPPYWRPPQSVHCKHHSVSSDICSPVATHNGTYGALSAVHNACNVRGSLQDICAPWDACIMPVMRCPSGTEPRHCAPGLTPRRRLSKLRRLLWCDRHDCDHAVLVSQRSAWNVARRAPDIGRVCGVDGRGNQRNVCALGHHVEQ